jgi:hypothetical protein
MWSLSYRATLEEEFNLDLCLGAPFPFPGYGMALIFVIKGSVQGGSFYSIDLCFCCVCSTYVRVDIQMWFYPCVWGQGL